MGSIREEGEGEEVNDEYDVTFKNHDSLTLSTDTSRKKDLLKSFSQRYAQILIYIFI
jgi:hypothetical protein